MTIMNRPRLRCLYVAVVAVACGVMPATQSTAGTTATQGMSGSAATFCNMGTTTFNLSFTVANNSVTNLTFDGSTPGSASGSSKTATTSKTYTFKCNSASKVITLTANAAVNGAKTQNYTVNVTGGSTNVSVSTSGSSSGSGTFTPGLISLSAGITYTVIVTTVTPSSNANAAIYSTSFTIQ